ncbi:phage tail tape measure protein, TP901 family, core region [Staphylococcus gallinarum]|uniref:Phage tail tape measure protein, TP901 family, core region n=1 Tax=Staphylococcus gallinarum TaxID=1293 RepID=A0A380FL26_STAGA|nr:phage tail tape measure protein, TP901 family, core region [Staphylococcus gallinarum]
MAEEQVRSMRVELSMRDMGVERTTNQIMTSFRNMKSEMMNSTRMFNRAEKSSQSYNNQLRNLRITNANLKKELEAAVRAEAKMVKQHGENSSQALKASANVSKLKEEIDYLGREIDKTSADMREYNLSQEKLAKANSTPFGRMTQQLKGISPKLKSVGAGMKNVGQSMSMYVTAPVTLGFGAAIKKSADFGGEMSKVGAIAGASGKELSAMKDQAIDLGAKTSLSASEVASGMKEMASLGFTAKQTMDAIPGAISAAEASGADLATTTGVMASTINQFNLKASDSGHIADVLAVAANKSAADINFMGDAMKYAGTPAHTLGMSMEDTSAAIMVMSDAGLKGEQAGTTLRASLTRLASPTGNAKKAMESMGITLTDTQGKFVGMPKLIGQFKDGLKGMTKEQKLATVSQIVGQESASGFLAMINAGPSKIDKYSQSLKNSNGESGKAAKKMKDNLKGSLEQLGGAFESLAISIGDSFAPAIRVLADWVSKIVEAFNNAPQPVKVFVGVLALIAAAIGPVLVGLGALVASLGAIAGSATAMSIIGGVFAALTSPVTLIIAAIVALGAAFVVAYKKSETFRNIVNTAFSGIVNGAKLLWSGVMAVLRPIGAAFAQFGGEIRKSIGSFWAENGPQFMQAMANIKTGFSVMWQVVKPIIMAIGAVFKAVFGAIVATVQFFMPVIQGLFRAGWAIIKYIIISTWEAIKGVISGALKVIMGVIQIFSGLFTGNFKLMWQGVKNIFFGALQFIWNLVQLWFVGKIFGVFKLGLGLIKGIVSKSMGGIKAVFSWAIGGIWNIVKAGFTKTSSFTRSIFNGLWKFIKAVWSNIKLAVTNPVALIRKIVPNTFRTMSNVVRAIFNGLKKAISVIWRTLKTVVVNVAKALSNALRGNFSGMRKNLQNITNALKNMVIKLWRILKNTVISVAKSLWNGVKGIFKSLYNTAKNITQNLRDAVVKKWRNLKKSVVDLATGAKDGVVKGFKAMYNKGKEWLEKLKEFIGNAKAGFKKVATNLGKSVANGAISGLNAMIDGINTLSDKIMNKKLIKKKIPKLSTGTGANPLVKTDSQGRLTRSTKAVVNDKGIGNARGPGGHKELIRRRNGRIQQLAGSNRRVTLRKGDAVYNGAQSKMLRPHLSTGTGGMFDILGGGKKTEERKT